MFLFAFDAGSVAIAALSFFALMVPLVVIHEFGHFLAAKAFGIRVLEFGVGFPPRIRRATLRLGETEYTLNWLPIGGFVKLLGEEDPTDPRSLAAAPAWKRLCVMFAGVAMNLVLAVGLMAASFMLPRERPLSMAQVVDVAPGSPAALATVTGAMRDGSEPAQGLQPGDLILDVGGRQVRNTGDVIYANELNLGKTLTWVVKRAGATLEAQVYARWDPPAGQGATGVSIAPPSTCAAYGSDGECTDLQLVYPYTESVSDPPWVAVPKGAKALVESLVLAKNELQKAFIGASNPSVNTGPVISGPVGIAATTGNVVQEAGWRSALELAALLSLNLAIFNALPLPMLDGGRVLFVLIEIARRGKRIAPRKEALVHLTGFALFMAFAVIMTFFDVARLVS